RDQQIRNWLSAAQALIISSGENRHDLGHVPQLFSRARVVRLSAQTRATPISPHCNKKNL
ncbi:MAG TPA: hypothetical protein VN872_06515, partial [Candidatus Acidoferrum sp.]|nr:hypothetical protein [Candidatus Acidoferrum sp.]